MRVCDDVVWCTATCFSVIIPGDSARITEKRLKERCLSVSFPFLATHALTSTKELNQQPHYIAPNFQTFF